jgi:allantoate deiminase
MRSLSGEKLPVGVKLVDWADEEGARFGRSLFGSSACAGNLDPKAVGKLRDADGQRLADVVAEYGVDLDTCHDAVRWLEGAQAYLELHIEQGPVLERHDLPLGVVLGTFGVERYRVTFSGAHAHAGSTPMDARRDAFLAAAASALAWRQNARERDDVRSTVGSVTVSPGIPTAFNGTCEVSLDLRAFGEETLAQLLVQAKQRADAAAEAEECSVAWDLMQTIEPIHFDQRLIQFAEEAVTEVAGKSMSLPSGPLHDAAEMAKCMPTVMLFVRSIGGVSHTKLEDSFESDIELSVKALAALADRTIAANAA